jgi:hypothetical protein
MNFDANLLKLGDTFYTVRTKYNVPGKNRKETRTIDGEQWFKYVKTREYRLITNEVVGMITKKLDGKLMDSVGNMEVLDEYTLATEFCIKVIGDLGPHDIAYDQFIVSEHMNIFLDKDSAECYIKEQHKLHNKGKWTEHDQ